MIRLWFIIRGLYEDLYETLISEYGPKSKKYQDAHRGAEKLGKYTGHVRVPSKGVEGVWHLLFREPILETYFPISQLLNRVNISTDKV